MIGRLASSLAFGAVAFLCIATAPGNPVVPAMVVAAGVVSLSFLILGEVRREP
jgi:hypothetical protein